MTANMKPKWYTKASDLGVIKEGQYYKFTLESYTEQINGITVINGGSGYTYVPMVEIMGGGGQGATATAVIKDGKVDKINVDNPGSRYTSPPIITISGRNGSGATAITAITYKVVTGKLPKGIVLNEMTGELSGIPTGNNNENDTLHRFTIRATNDSGIRDKSFTLSIAKQDTPEWNSPMALPPVTELTYINEQIEVTDENNNVTFDLISGSLPSGTRLTSAGIITGFVNPVSNSMPSTFTVRASDGQTSILREFTLPITRVTDKSRPVFKHTIGNIGTFVHDNKFSFKVDAVDYSTANADGEYGDSTLTYTISSTPSYIISTNYLSIDPRTGWIHGVLPFISKDREEFTFVVTATRTGTTIATTHTFKMALLFSPDSEIKWKTNENLGSIIAGTISTLNVEAETQSDTSLIYELDPVDNTLPAGMELNSSGELTGRPSFQTFQLDGGTTSFDDITIDKKFSFTVKVRNIARTLSSERKFNLTIEPVDNNEPKEDWYIDLFPNDAERRIWEDIVYNRQDIPDQYLYRSSDIYFGRQDRARVLFVPGLPAETIDDYFRYVFRNHYTINIRFGDFKYAKATNNNGDHIYDIVYVDVVDKFDPPEGENINLEIEYEQGEFSNVRTIDESGTIDNSNLYAGTTSVNKLFPASLKRMKARLEQILGRTIDISTLPDWMSTVQDDGTVIGYVPVCPIAYVKPGLGKKVLHYLNTNANIRLHEVDFTVDRYVIDQYFTQNYNTETNTWDGTDDIEPRTNILEGNKYLKFPREDLTDLP